MNNNNRTQNTFMNISSALDELVGGPPAPVPSEIISAPPTVAWTNPIPSAPQQIGDTIPTVFNPAALTINIPIVEDDDIVDISGGMFGEIEDDSETPEEDSAVTVTHTVEHIPNNTPMLSPAMSQHHMRFNGMDDLIQFLQNNHPEALNTDDDTSGNETSSSLDEERECGICYSKIGIDKIVNSLDYNWSQLLCLSRGRCLVEYKILKRNASCCCPPLWPQKFHILPLSVFILPALL